MQLFSGQCIYITGYPGIQQYNNTYILHHWVLHVKTLLRIANRRVKWV
jgi:hypothetical protein